MGLVDENLVIKLRFYQLQRISHIFIDLFLFIDNLSKKMEKKHGILD